MIKTIIIYSFKYVLIMVPYDRELFSHFIRFTRHRVTVDGAKDDRTQEVEG